MIFVSRLLDNDVTIVVEGEDSVKNFMELVQRATNLWPDAPPEIKAFADKITNYQWADGALQDYDQQNTSKKSNACRHYNITKVEGRPDVIKCKDCGAVKTIKHHAFQRVEEDHGS